jgi:type I restriction enzyme S subunit
MSWRVSRLGDVLTLKRGHDLPDSQRVEGDIPVISSSGVTGRHNEPKANGPGVVTGRYGTLGRVYYVDEPYWPLNTALYVTDFKGNNPRFLAYFLQNVLGDYQSDKAAVPGVDRNVLHELAVKYPELATQESIARVLSAYDDLIENNRRRMVLLEDAAREIYSEWFVRLRFPGHQHVNVIDGVPEGWDRIAVGDLCTEIRESVDPTKLAVDTPYIGLEHMPRRSISLDSWSAVDQVTSSKHRFRQGDILFGKIRPYFHKVGVTFLDGVASSDAIVIRSRVSLYAGLLLLTVSSDPFIAMVSQTMKEGSKMPRADWKQMQAYPIVVPPRGILSTFESAVRLIVDQLKTLTLLNIKLRDARDLLLPPLMSGEITV